MKLITDADIDDTEADVGADDADEADDADDADEADDADDAAADVDADGDAPRTPIPGLSGLSPQAFTAFGAAALPGLLGVEVLSSDLDRLTCRAPIRPELLAPHGYLHGGTLVSIADTLCGYGTIANLPAGSTGFVTVELNSSFLGTLRSGGLFCEATPLHRGRSTQIWDAVVTDENTGRRLAAVRCTQLVLHPET
jgi:uncharacterized protein (TIGR00369 family)